jgi:acetyltransferase-like isoleucine patch superfamily enzyme
MNLMNLMNVVNRFRVMLLKKSSNKKKIEYLRKQGMKIGIGCRLNTFSFSTEPYLIEIGDHVAIAGGSEIITHDGAIWSFLNDFPNADVFGMVKIGNNVFIGDNCTILPNTTIGDNCVVGAGSVVRGKFPENSVIIGNPAKIVMKTSVQKFMYSQNPGLMYTMDIPDKEKAVIIKKHFGIK